MPSAISSRDLSARAQRPPNAARWALRLALAGTIAALAIAYTAQYWGGLAPCVLCLYQRAALGAAATLAGLGLLVLRFAPGVPLLAAVLPAALALLASVGIAGFHVGVEQGWWEGLAACSAPALDFSKPLSDLTETMLSAPVVACDEVPWSLFGISIAGWNVLFSLALALIVLSAARRRRA